MKKRLLAADLHTFLRVHRRSEKTEYCGENDLNHP
jgi:hypothetical protein